MIQPILIAMKESTQSKFDEVVITGTGAKKKMTVTGAVTSVNVEDLKQAPSTNVLTGSIPGVIKRSTVKAPKQITPKPVIGMRKYKKYLKENLIPPTDETCSGMKGAIILTFSVNKKGRPNDVKVKKGLCESADKEAIRLILDGPDWTYGNTSAEVTVKFK